MIWPFKSATFTNYNTSNRIPMPAVPVLNIYPVQTKQKILKCNCKYMYEN